MKSYRVSILEAFQLCFSVVHAKTRVTLSNETNVSIRLTAYKNKRNDWLAAV